MRSGFKIGRIAGIEIDIDWSWLFTFVLIAWNLSTTFSQLHTKWRGSLAWGVAILAALLFFGSALLHELAHSQVAKLQGFPLRSITLFLFGGVSNIQREPASPCAEFLMTIVGPITSFALGSVVLLLVGAYAGQIDAMTGSATNIASLSPLPTMLLWLGSINILLALFNVIPGFPLDGGCVLRSILRAITGNLRRVMHGVPVARLMRANPPAVASAISISSLVHDHIMGTDDYAFPVVDDGCLTGMVALANVRTVARHAWDTTTVRDIVTPASKLIVAAPEEDADDAWNQLMARDVQQLPVVRGSQLAGLFRHRDITK